MDILTLALGGVAISAILILAGVAIIYMQQVSRLEKKCLLWAEYCNSLERQIPLK